MPSAAAAAATFVPTFPQPTIPIVFPLKSTPCRSETRSSAEVMYCATDAALHPAAFLHTTPCRLHQSVSMWSVPMVAVARILTRECSRSAASHFVRVRTMRASASRTVSGVISPGSR